MNMYFHEVYERFRQITNASTQVELARVLGIRQSSISDAKRRGSIPAEWYLTLFEKFGLNPDWLKKGIGPMYLRTELGYQPSNDSLTAPLPEEGERYGGSMTHGLLAPVYACSSAAGSAGSPFLKAEYTMSLPRHFVRPEIKVFSINSAAMEPTLRRYACVGVNCTIRRPVSGEVFALLDRHEGVIVRRLHVDADTSRVVLRTDTAGYPETAFSIEAAPERIVGRVVWVLQEF